MKTKLCIVLTALGLFFSSFLATPGFAIEITPSGEADALANTILGPSISLVPGSASYTGSSLASGTFTGGIASGLGIESGIILTSGYAASAVGPNQNGDKLETIGCQFPAWTCYDSSTNLGLPGDSALDTLAGGNPTFDASVLRFNFITNHGDVSFKFVFASEEYLNWVDTEYNDVCGFFLDGENIALVPATTTPITVNAINPLVNSEYYNNNIDPSVFDLEYDGFTTVLVAQALNLSAGEHTISLGIADTYDGNLDAAVFIQAGSFNPSPLPPTVLLLGSGLLGLAGLRKFRKG